MMNVYRPHPLRIQRRRVAGFRLPEGTKCVSCPGPWGNPFTVKRAKESGYAVNDQDARDLCVKAFDDWLRHGEKSSYWFLDGAEQWKWMREHLRELKGLQLACFCPLDRPCHADVLARLANAEQTTVTVEFRVWVFRDSHGNTFSTVCDDGSDIIPVYGLKDQAGGSVYFEDEACYSPTWCEKHGIACRSETRSIEMELPG